MSLIFEALKKGRAAAAHPPLAAQPIPTTLAPPQQGKESSFAWSGTLLSMLAGMLLACVGGGLYWAGKASNINPSDSTPAVHVEITPAKTPATRFVAPPPTAVVAAPPAAAAVAVAVAVAAVMPAKLAPASPTPIPVIVPVKLVKTAIPELVKEVKTAVRPTINTQVQVSTEPNSFDVREAFQIFVQKLQMGQLPEAQAAADRISTAMGKSHVMSLRAQGYLALKNNDLGQAKGQYLLLHQLLPEDREAGLNLALIEWRQGEKETAAKRVAYLLEKFPNDPEIQALYLNVRNP